jgi:hypothetical protein
MDDDRRRRPFGRRSRLRSFAIVLTTAGAIATVRRLRRSAVPRVSGLAAFEDAPCFLEIQAEADRAPDPA